ncbi:hypothetical protein C8R45DRAFT_1078044 [Mycena sanguinolenta]|nr:hypothetical protein C8R45DRAFT_1078044 [Mycena sanguinolenta]
MAPLPHIAGNPKDLVARPRLEVRGAGEIANMGLGVADASASNLPSPGAIAGIVIGFLIWIICVCIVVRNWGRKRVQAKAKAEGNAASGAGPSSPPSPEKSDTGPSQYRVQQPA